MSTPIIEKITSACDTLKTIFAELANDAVRAAEDMESAVGRLTVWECRQGYWDGKTPSKKIYLNHKPSGAEQFMHLQYPIREVPHPDADTARAKVKELFKDIHLNDANYKANAEQLAKTPAEIGKFITEWESIANQMANKVAGEIPSNASYIKSRGSLTGWLSSTASAAYNATISSQNSAADETVALIGGMTGNCAKLLQSMTAAVQDMAAITHDQDAMYSDWALGSAKVPTDYDGFLKYVGDAVSVVDKVRQQERAKRAALGRKLNDTIVALLDIGALERRITMMGEASTDGGWPSPATISVGVTDPGDPSNSILQYNAEYFVDHARFWDDVSDELEGLEKESSQIANLPIMFAILPEFSASQSDALNGLGKKIRENAIAQGKTATAETATLLRQTIRAYLAAEAENEASAKEIYREASGG